MNETTRAERKLELVQELLQRAARILLDTEPEEGALAETLDSVADDVESALTAIEDFQNGAMDGSDDVEE